MAVRLKIREIAEKRGIQNPKQLSETTGVPYAACHAIWKGNQKQIALETINKFCESLKVKPGSLFEYVTES